MMGPTVDFRNDYLTWNGTEVVRLDTSRRLLAAPVTDPQLRHAQTLPPADGARTQDASRSDLIPIAKRRSISTREKSPSGGAYTGAECRWLLPAVLVREAPKPGDVIVDSDNTRWTALTVDRNRNGATFLCGCVNLVIAYDLRDTINIERPAISYDAAGASVMAFPSDAVNPGGVNLYRNLLCRVQLLTQEIKEERGIRGFESRYDVPTEQRVRVTMQDRILWQGAYLDITGFREADRIDSLNVIEAAGKV